MENGEQQALSMEVFSKEDEGVMGTLNEYDPTKIRVEQRSVNLGTLLGMLRARQIIFEILKQNL